MTRWLRYRKAVRAEIAYLQECHDNPELSEAVRIALGASAVRLRMALGERL